MAHSCPRCNLPQEVTTDLVGLVCACAGCGQHFRVEQSGLIPLVEGIEPPAVEIARPTMVSAVPRRKGLILLGAMAGAIAVTAYLVSLVMEWTPGEGMPRLFDANVRIARAYIAEDLPGSKIVRTLPDAPWVYFKIHRTVLGSPRAQVIAIEIEQGKVVQAFDATEHYGPWFDPFDSARHKKWKAGMEAARSRMKKAGIDPDLPPFVQGLALQAAKAEAKMEAREQQRD